MLGDMDTRASMSEDNGIGVLREDDLTVLSVGISTGGVAEIRMATAHPERRIIATTIDPAGAEFARDYIAAQGLTDQIEVKIEDVAAPLPYADGSFDYVYARLVLHYLSKRALDKALAELHRVLKVGGRLFIVVRSTACPDARHVEAVFDPKTHLTIRCHTDQRTGEAVSYERYFHTEASIKQHVWGANFGIVHTETYDEHLFTDFMRTTLAPHTDNVIELLAAK